MGPSTYFGDYRKEEKENEEKVLSHFAAPSLDLADTLLRAAHLFCPLAQVSKKNAELRKDTDKLLKGDITSAS